MKKPEPAGGQLVKKKNHDKKHSVWANVARPDLPPWAIWKACTIIASEKDWQFGIPNRGTPLEKPPAFSGGSVGIGTGGQKWQPQKWLFTFRIASLFPFPPSAWWWKELDVRLSEKIKMSDWRPLILVVLVLIAQGHRGRDNCYWYLKISKNRVAPICVSTVSAGGSSLQYTRSVFLEFLEAQI